MLSASKEFGKVPVESIWTVAQVVDRVRRKPYMNAEFGRRDAVETAGRNEGSRLSEMFYVNGLFKWKNFPQKGCVDIG